MPDSQMQRPWESARLLYCLPAHINMALSNLCLLHIALEKEF